MNNAAKKDRHIVMDYIEKPFCFGSSFVEAGLDEKVYSKYVVKAKTDCHFIKVSRRALKGVIQRIQ